MYEGLEYLGLKGKECMGDYNIWDWKEKSVRGIRISGIERKGVFGGLEYLELKGMECMVD